MQYGYNNYNSLESQFKRLSMEDKLKRQQAVSGIMGAIPDFSYLANCLDIYYNIKKYPNEFLESVTMEYSYYGGVDEKSEHRKKFEELWQEYSKEVKRANEEAAAQYSQYLQASNPQVYNPVADGQPNYLYGQTQPAYQNYNPHQYNPHQGYTAQQYN